MGSKAVREDLKKLEPEPCSRILHKVLKLSLKDAKAWVEIGIKKANGEEVDDWLERQGDDRGWDRDNGGWGDRKPYESKYPAFEGDIEEKIDDAAKKHWLDDTSVDKLKRIDKQVASDICDDLDKERQVRNGSSWVMREIRSRTPKPPKGSGKGGRDRDRDRDWGGRDDDRKDWKRSSWDEDDGKRKRDENNGDDEGDEEDDEDVQAPTKKARAEDPVEDGEKNEP